MTTIHITDECEIYNDMPRGWVKGKDQPKWHKSLYNRWIGMWRRCKNPRDERYKYYKDVHIDESFRYLSNYIDIVTHLKNFDLLINNPSLYAIDKDLKDREYSPSSLTIITMSANSKEVFDRCGNPIPKKPIIGIPVDNSKQVLVYKSLCDAEKDAFKNSSISECCRGKKKTHKGYKWFYLEVIEL